VALSRFIGAPAQRCIWYQLSHVTVAAQTSGTPYDAIVSDAGIPYRYMIATTGTPLKAKTLLVQGSNPPVPYHVNVALVSPYVINVMHLR
jgi:hypothetical protein